MSHPDIFAALAIFFLGAIAAYVARISDQLGRLQRIVELVQENTYPPGKLTREAGRR